MTFRVLRVAILSSVLASSGGGDQILTPAPPAPPPAPASSPWSGVGLANWKADAVVVSATGTGTACGWGTMPGVARNGVEWRITVDGPSITLEEDMDNWPTDHLPFEGTLSGEEFTAAYNSGHDYLRYVCQFRGGTLTGRFSPDVTSFEAEETLAWGPPEHERVVRRRWTGRRRY